MRRIRPGHPKLALAYVRVSTDSQKLGPEAQRAQIEAWARQEGVGVVDWFEDTGVCGETDLEDRPGLVAAVAALPQQQAGLLVVAKRDRLARDPAVAALIERSVRRAGACVVSADGLGNGEAPGEMLLRTILDGAAAYELAVTRQRTRAAAQAKRARGLRAGTIPFGYRLAAEGPRNAAGRIQALEPDPGEQAVLARVRQLRQQGLSLRRIVTELEQTGIRGRSGQPLRLTQVARLAEAERPSSRC
jgi:DNA invertase Pin-like site-specific DNA recombinase